MAADFLYLNKDIHYTDRFDLTCCTCKRPLRSVIFWISKYDRRRSQQVTMCQECCLDYKGRRKMRSIAEEVRLVQVSSAIPKTAQIIFLRPTELTESRRYSGVTLATAQDEAKIIDKTRYAGRESFEGMHISMVEEEPKLGDLTLGQLMLRPESAEEVVADPMEILKAHMDSQIVYSDIKQIGGRTE